MSLQNGLNGCSLKQLTEVAEQDDGTKWAYPADDVIRDSGSVAEHRLNEIEQPYHEVQAVESKPQLGCKDRLNKSNCPEKMVFVVSILTVIVVCCSMMSFQWFLPYLYTAYLSVLIPIRAYKYTNLKWQFFLADWCYVANAMSILFLWAAPYKSNYFMIVFGVTNGPVTWSIVLFRNCLVPHSIERMTCLIIHLMPSLITYLVRWYPTETSQHWYQDFANTTRMEMATGWEFLWLVAVPLACYMCHLVLYLALFVWALGSTFSSSEYLNNYTFIAYQSNNVFSRAIRCKGGKFRFLVYMIFQGIYASITIAMTWLWFNFWIAHIVFLCFVFTIATYNGSTYYLDLFPKKAFESDPYRLCGKTPE
ncbi:uncharacterized membrane protein YGR149W [Strongylocentrotus purpuratus]|uniref:Glycerophosphocholine acyltransferase 1 n=1 Tax=Strongylocentrotus purpuratus TaxID=7668 RepID=A0A7M7NWK4_STRPU|nr:uncharacterized membrane protein YGR149W [Strongylocentrotus purpuratus]